MKKVTLNALNNHLYELDNGEMYVKIEEGSFAEACVHCNNIAELEDCLENRTNANSDCEDWGITKKEWLVSIEKALCFHVLKWIR